MKLTVGKASLRGVIILDRLLYLRQNGTVMSMNKEVRSLVIDQVLHQT